MAYDCLLQVLYQHAKYQGMSRNGIFSFPIMNNFDLEVKVQGHMQLHIVN